jgi:hypothetical protein
MELASLHHVIFITGRDEGKLNVVANKVRKMGGKIEYAAGDVGDEESVAKVIKQANDFLGKCLISGKFRQVWRWCRRTCSQCGGGKIRKSGNYFS